MNTAIAAAEMDMSNICQGLSDAPDQLYSTNYICKRPNKATHVCKYIEKELPSLVFELKC